jgi:hypothetical protein
LPGLQLHLVLLLPSAPSLDALFSERASLEAASRAASGSDPGEVTKGEVVAKRKKWMIDFGKPNMSLRECRIAFKRMTEQTDPSQQCKQKVARCSCVESTFVVA